MPKLIETLGFDSGAKSARNVWRVSLGSFFLFGINYMHLVMPEEIFFLLALILSLFGFASITAHIYWTMKQWSTLSEDRKLGSFFYILLMTLVTTLLSLIPLGFIVDLISR